jgi:hypothetical protein
MNLVALAGSVIVNAALLSVLGVASQAREPHVPER